MHSAEVELRPGSRFGGYRVDALVGRGGMATVYRAEHVHLRRPVALKVPIPHLASEPAFRERFIRESRAAATVVHPNVVAVYDAGEIEGILYLAMQYVDGENLSGLLKRDGPLPGERAASVVAQIATALDDAHGRGLVHRDVKPANVLVDGDRCYVADFGLTKLTDASALTSTGDLLGTLSYAAPEQIEGRAVDRRADVYALGATAYECVVGKTPFAHRTGAALIYAQLTESPPRPTDRRPELPAAVNAVLAKALAKRPADRYATCGELAAAFAEALSGGERVVVAPPPVEGIPLPPALERCRTHPLIGRERELDEIDSAKPVILALTGEPGIGKSRLAAELAARAHAGGATVLYGRADEDPVIPYEPFVEALRHLCAHLDVAALPEEAGALAPLVPELAHLRAPAPTGEPGSDRYRMFEAVARVLAYAGRQDPIVIVLEDLQWADRSTLLLFRHVVESTLPARMTAIVTYRPLWVGDDHPLNDVLTALGRRHELRHVELAALDAEQTGRLAASRLGSEPTPELVAALVERTSGNPLFVAEILRDDATATATALPETVRHVVRRRLERLSAPTRDVLAVAALLHGEVSPATLAAVVGDDVDDAIDEALRAHILVDHGERYVLAHSLIRDVLVAGMPRAERRRAHLRIAQALERRRAEPAVLARHFVAARANEPALRYSVEAARAASKAHAHEQAAALLTQAQELLDDRDDVTLLLELGDARLRASQPDCLETFGAAAALARETGDAEALAHAALGLAGRFTDLAGDTADAGVLDEALAALDPGASLLRVRVLARLAQAARAREISEEAVAMAERLDDDPARLAALAGRHAAWLDEPAVRSEIGSSWVALADRTGELEAAALARHWHLLDLADAAAERELAVLIELADRLHQPLYEYCALVWQAALGDGDAEAIVARAAVVAEQMRIPVERFAQEVALRSQG